MSQQSAPPLDGDVQAKASEPDRRARSPDSSGYAADPPVLSDHGRVTERSLPTALRATRLPARWPWRRPGFRYDARYFDGSVVQGVEPMTSCRDAVCRLMRGLLARPPRKRVVRVCQGRGSSTQPAAD